MSTNISPANTVEEDPLAQLEAMGSISLRCWKDNSGGTHAVIWSENDDLLGQGKTLRDALQDARKRATTGDEKS